MVFSGNWVDLVVLIFLFFYVWEGFRRGFLVHLFEMASFILSFIIGLRFYVLAANLFVIYFNFSRGFANAAGFILVAVVSETLLGLLFTLALRSLPKKIFHSPWNRFLGFLPALIDGLILVAFFATALVSLPISGKVKAALLDSEIVSRLVDKTRGLDKSLNAVFGDAVQETLTFLTVRPDSSERLDLGFTTTAVTNDEPSESEMLRLINKERLDRNLRPLTLRVDARTVARAHSRDMFARGYFSHVNPDGLSPFDRLKNAGVGFSVAGENLAYAPNVIIAHEGLMNSPGHRANILNPDFAQVGLGVIDGGVYGKMFTQLFTN